MLRAAREQKLDATRCRVTAVVGIKRNEAGNLVLDTELKIHIPGMPPEQVMELAGTAHRICPYSNATRGNIDVKLTVI